MVSHSLRGQSAIVGKSGWQEFIGIGYIASTVRKQSDKMLVRPSLFIQPRTLAHGMVQCLTHLREPFLPPLFLLRNALTHVQKGESIPFYVGNINHHFRLSILPSLHLKPFLSSLEVSFRFTLWSCMC